MLKNKVKVNNIAACFFTYQTLPKTGSKKARSWFTAEAPQTPFQVKECSIALNRDSRNSQGAALEETKDNPVAPLLAEKDLIYSI